MDRVLVHLGHFTVMGMAISPLSVFRSPDYRVVCQHYDVNSRRSVTGRAEQILAGVAQEHLSP
jgi:hypothetical protein